MPTAHASGLERACEALLGIPVNSGQSAIATELPFNPDSIMGWLRQILLGDLGQSIDIQETATAVEAQRAALDRRRQELAALEIRTERLHLAVTALSRFLVSKGVIDPTELEAFIRQVDAEDGKIDGKLAAEAPMSRSRFPVHDPQWDREAGGGYPS